MHTNHKVLVLRLSVCVVLPQASEREFAHTAQTRGAWDEAMGLVLVEGVMTINEVDP